MRDAAPILFAALWASHWQTYSPTRRNETAARRQSWRATTTGTKPASCFFRSECRPDSICGAMGITLANLFPDTPKRNGGKAAIVASYDYRDEAGKLLFQVCRLEPKDFKRRRPDATQPDSWLWKTAGVRSVVYRLPETLAAIQCGEVIHLPEGEKDVAALVANGFAATCNPGGAGKWRDDYTPNFTAAQVVIVADKDGPGRNHARLAT